MRARSFPGVSGSPSMVPPMAATSAKKAAPPPSGRPTRGEHHLAVESPLGKRRRFYCCSKPLRLRLESTCAARAVAQHAEEEQKSSSGKRQQTFSAEIEDKYNEAMKAYSASPFEYQHEKGLYYHEITSAIFVGTQPWEKGSIEYLKEKEGVSILYNTQEDGNFDYWKVDIKEREEEAKKAGVLLHRQPIVDFSFDSLREQLPEAVSEFDRLMDPSKNEVIYCHCTAGMGRSPAVVIAYLYWTDDRFESLDEAYEFLTSKRPCGPKKEVIRQATVDILESEGDSLPTKDGRMKVDTGLYYGEDSKKLKDEEKNLDSRGTTLTRAQREIIKKKLRTKSGTYTERRKDGVLEILKRFFLGAGPTDD